MRPCATNAGFHFKYYLSMKNKTFIFFGKSGCGKGTQAQLLKSYLEKNDLGRRTVYVETGARFRDFMLEANYTSKLVNSVISHGGLLPGFLPIWIWTNFLIRNLEKDDHIILDGLSRRFSEATILDEALMFYAREKPYVVFVNVSDQWASKRLISRGRADDTADRIKERLEWFGNEVMKSVNYFKGNKNYNFIDLNGEQSIEEVQNELLSKIDFN